MKNNNKNIHFFAIAALAATLMAGQVQVSPVYADNTAVQLSSLIPDNVTVEQPVPLSDISLPDSEYGTLSWVDSSSVPSRRVQSYDVVFRPYDSSVLSRISGWDGESDAIYSSVTVVVSGMGAESEESVTWKEDSEENYDENYDDSQTENAENQDNYAENQDDSEVKENENAADDGQASEKEPEATVTPSEGEVTEAPKATEVPSEAEGTETPETTETPSEDKEENTEITVTEKPSEEENKTEKEDETDAENNQKSDDNKKTEDTKEEPTAAPEVTEVPEVTETPAAIVTPAADKNNIFDGADKDIKEDDRSTEFEENLTAEQKAEMADENHSCNGITVSGIDLPYYVQFRVASGDDYEFTNESEANVFQSYEFELWDLKNNTEYAVSDGEYVSVTVPVKAGYSYTIEHLLDSGAMETIVPSVDGSTMVFSTHSFSPFGIAGSKTLVGEEIEEDGYDTGSDTDTSDSAQTAGLTPVADNSTTSSDNTANTAANTETSTGNAATAGAETADTSTVTTAQSSENVSDDAQNEEDSSSSVKAVHTNDPTRILPFVILAVAAGAIVGVIVYLRKRKK